MEPEGIQPDADETLNVEEEPQSSDSDPQPEPVLSDEDVDETVDDVDETPTSLDEAPSTLHAPIQPREALSMAQEHLQSKRKPTPIPPLIAQVSLRRLGVFASSYLANDLYYLDSVVRILVPLYGVERLRQDFPRYKQIEPKLNELSRHIFEVKLHYDLIEDKKFSHQDKEVVLKRDFLRKASRVPLIAIDLYDLFVFLVLNTQLHRSMIPTEAFKILEHRDLKRLDMTKKTSPQNITSPEEAIVR